MTMSDMGINITESQNCRKLKILIRTAKSYIFAEMQGKPLEIDMGQNKNDDLSQ